MYYVLKGSHPSAGGNITVKHVIYWTWTREAKGLGSMLAKVRGSDYLLNAPLSSTVCALPLAPPFAYISSLPLSKQNPDPTLELG
jgi:hypothetical protein